MSVPAVIVPTHNRASALSSLLLSLRRQTTTTNVVVVDNGSTDETAELLAHRFAEVSVVKLVENLGFARAVNRGIESTDAEIVVLVNDDVVCSEGFVAELCVALDPPAGIVMSAGVLLNSMEPDRIDSAGIIFDRVLFGIDYLHGLPVSVLERPVPDPLGPTGGAAAFDRAAFDAVGGFDERFFAYLEDVDLVARLIAKGSRCRLAPGARALHEHSATLGAGSRRKNELMGWGRGYTIGKYRLHKRPALLARAAVAEAVIVAGQAVVDRTIVGASARLRGFRAGLRVPAEPLPPLSPIAAEITLAQGLRYRLSRRRPMKKLASHRGSKRS